jgi:hypothetical protein
MIIRIYVPVFPISRPEGKRQLERPERRLEDNIKRNLQVVRWGHGVD